MNNKVKEFYISCREFPNKITFNIIFSQTVQLFGLDLLFQKANRQFVMATNVQLLTKILTVYVFIFCSVDNAAHNQKNSISFLHMRRKALFMIIELIFEMLNNYFLFSDNFF